MTGEEWAAQTTFVSKIRGVFEKWSFLNLLCISFAIKVIKKRKTVSGTTFYVEFNGIASFILLRLVFDIWQ